MAKIITNQASINFVYNGKSATAVSNIATATLADALSVEKKSIERSYRAGDELTFSVNLVNSGAVPLNNVEIFDDLGTYIHTSDTDEVTVTPLDFIAPALLFVNGRYSGELTPTFDESGMMFKISSLAAGAHAEILYKASVNGYARLAFGSAILNKISVEADETLDPVTATNTVAAENYADVTINKTMSPTNIVDGSPVTYAFRLYNYGNSEATGIVLGDTFDPIPGNIEVYVNGRLISTDRYTYTAGELTLPTGEGYSLRLEAAEIVQDSTGAVTVTPSTMLISVTGAL